MTRTTSMSRANGMVCGQCWRNIYSSWRMQKRPPGRKRALRWRCILLLRYVRYNHGIKLKWIWTDCFPVLSFNTKWSLWLANAIGIVKLVTLILYVALVIALDHMKTDETASESPASSFLEATPRWQTLWSTSMMPSREHLEQLCTGQPML